MDWIREMEIYEEVEGWNPSFLDDSMKWNSESDTFYWDFPDWKVDASAWSFSSIAPRAAASVVKCTDCDEIAVEHIKFDCCDIDSCGCGGDYWFCQEHLDEWNGLVTISAKDFFDSLGD